MVAEPTTEVRVGVIGRPHGVRGQVTIAPLTDEPDRRFATGATVREDGASRAWTVEASHWQAGRLVVTLSGVPDRTAAEALRGVRLLADVPAAERPTDADAEAYWDRDLVGLTVCDDAGKRIGDVRAVQHLPAQDVLEIRLDTGADVLVPLVRALVPEIALDKGLLKVADVGGLVSVDDRDDD